MAGVYSVKKIENHCEGVCVRFCKQFGCFLFHVRKYVDVDLNATIKRYDELWEVQDGRKWGEQCLTSLDHDEDEDEEKDEGEDEAENEDENEN